MASRAALATKAIQDRLQPRQWMGPLESRWMQVDGHTIHARVSTAPVPMGRPRVILVHGLPMSSLYMAPLAARLASDYHVYAPDLPGIGNSAKPQHTLSIPELADALAAWMHVAGLQKAAFVGNSFGCQVIAGFAVRYPQHVDRVVLEDPTMNPRARNVPQQLWHDLVDLTREPVSLLLIIVRDLVKCGVGRFLRTYAYALNDPVQDKLRLIRVPTLVVRGSGDSIVPQWWAEQVTRLVPHAQFVALLNAAHASNYARPQKLAHIIRPFLNAECAEAAASTSMNGEEYEYSTSI
jgi:pimeloyl-ACP methyl ester carboxylesterase